jgi:hypothetical protein
MALDKSGCIEGKIKYLDGAKEIILKENYCFDSLLRTISSFKKCSNTKECTSNLAGPFLVKVKDIEGKNGSPGFKICAKLNGIPQFLEFWDNENWIKSSRCIFNDGSFVDIGSLTLKVKYVE